MLKTAPKNATLRNPQQNVWNPEPVSGRNEQIIIYVFRKLRLSWNLQLEWNPRSVGGIRKL